MRALEDIFVDSSAWIALADSADSHHKEAASAYPSLLKNFRTLVTSNMIIAETYVVLLKEMGHTAGIDFLELLNASPRILKAWSNEATETEAEKILSKYSDQDFSYTDAVSFALMRKLNIKKAFSFDKHFVIAGFANIP